MLGATVNQRFGVWLAMFTPIAMEDWTAIGSIGASIVPGNDAPLRYFAEVSKAVLKVLKMAMFWVVFERTEQITGTTNINDKQLAPKRETDFSRAKVNNIVIVALKVPCTKAERSTRAWSSLTMLLAQYDQAK